MITHWDIEKHVKARAFKYVLTFIGGDKFVWEAVSYDGDPIGSGELRIFDITDKLPEWAHRTGKRREYLDTDTIINKMPDSFKSFKGLFERLHPVVLEVAHKDYKNNPDMMFGFLRGALLQYREMTPRYKSDVNYNNDGEYGS
jgi:hypothetical protein